MTDHNSLTEPWLEKVRAQEEYQSLRIREERLRKELEEVMAHIEKLRAEWGDDVYASFGGTVREDG